MSFTMKSSYKFHRNTKTSNYCYALSCRTDKMEQQPYVPALFMEELYQARKLSSHVDVYYVHRFCICINYFSIGFWNCSDGVVLFFQFITREFSAHGAYHVRSQSKY